MKVSIHERRVRWTTTTNTFQALVEARNYENTWPGVYKSTTGLIFLGTPFRGAEGMKLVDLLAAARREYEDEDIQPGVLSMLQPGNDFLLDVVDQFGKMRRAQAHKTKTMLACFYEQKPSNVGRIVGGKDFKAS
jgi:hypothetical protein